MSDRSATSAGRISTIRALSKRKRTLGGEEQVELAYLESVPEGADAERALERFARSGCNIIFTTSFGYMDATNAVAKKFPDVKFEHATGFKRESPNVSTYNSKFHEGRYVQGVIAAKMSKAGVAGYIASFPIPEVVMGINSFVLGAQSVNPGLQAQGRVGQHLVRPGQGSRRCQGADRPGRRHHHPAHRTRPRRCRSRPSAASRRSGRRPT